MITYARVTIMSTSNSLYFLLTILFVLVFPAAFKDAREGCLQGTGTALPVEGPNDLVTPSRTGWPCHSKSSIRLILDTIAS